MEHFAHVISKTWFATVCFTVAAILIWGPWLGWDAARSTIIPTLLITPVMWWLIIARKDDVRPTRGVMAGAVIGVLSQVAAHVIPMIWQEMTHTHVKGGEGGIAAAVAVVFYVMVAIGSAGIGALLGLLTLKVQRGTGAKLRLS